MTPFQQIMTSAQVVVFSCNGSIISVCEKSGLKFMSTDDNDNNKAGALTIVLWQFKSNELHVITV